MVLKNSWPLSESSWAFVQMLKDLEKNELKGMGHHVYYSCKILSVNIFFTALSRRKILCMGKFLLCYFCSLKNNFAKFQFGPKLFFAYLK